jgi:hypothetical protein
MKKWLWMMIFLLNAYSAPLYADPNSAMSDMDIDDLLNRAQGEGNRNISKVNKEVRSRLNSAKDIYHEHAQKSAEKLMQNQAFSGAGNRGTGSGLKSLALNSALVQETSCNGTYSKLGSIMKAYTDPELKDLRNSILSTKVQDVISKVKTSTANKEQAIKQALLDAENYDKTAKDAAGTASQSWGGPDEDPAVLLNSGRLPVNHSCAVNSMPYKAICASVANQWGGLASRFTAELLKKCW